MHVAVIHPKYTPFGGGARMIDDIVRLLAAGGARVTMLVREWSGTRPPGVEIRTVDPFYLGSAWREAGFRRAMNADRLAEFDLVFSDQKIPGIDVYLAGGGVHREYVASRERRAGALRRLALALNPASHQTARAEARLFASPRLRAVVCVSGRVRDDIVRWYGVPPQRLHVVYNGIDTQRFDAAWRDAQRATLRELHGLGARFTVAFVGGGMENKGIVPLLEALARSGLDFTLFVVGKDRRRARYEALARRLGIAERCRFVGPQSDVRPYYAMADVTVLASYFETFGLVCLESMAMGVPVLVSRHAGVAELVEDGRHGWRIDPERIDTLVDGLRRLAAQGAAMREACIALAARHSSGDMMRELQAVLDRLTTEAAPPAGTAPLLDARP